MSEKRFNCRLPEELHSELTKLSDRENRSMNTLIIIALDEFVSRAKTNPDQSPDTFNTIVSKLDEMIKIMRGAV